MNLYLDEDSAKGALVTRLRKAGHPVVVPADAALGLGEMVVELRRLHTVRLDLLRQLCRAGKRRARVQPLYREHLAKHFADTYCRIGLPEPYETL